MIVGEKHMVTIKLEESSDEGCIELRIKMSAGIAPDQDSKRATGGYSYENKSEGLRIFRSKAHAIINAENSIWADGELKAVYSPKGKIVYKF